MLKGQKGIENKKTKLRIIMQMSKMARKVIDLVTF